MLAASKDTNGAYLPRSLHALRCSCQELRHASDAVRSNISFFSDQMHEAPQHMSRYTSLKAVSICGAPGNVFCLVGLEAMHEFAPKITSLTLDSGCDQRMTVNRIDLVLIPWQSSLRVLKLTNIRLVTCPHRGGGHSYDLGLWEPDLPALHSLELSGSSILHLDLSGCRNLRELSLTGNIYLETCTGVGRLHSLEAFSCARHPSLEELDMSGCAQLRSLLCVNNLSLTSLCLDRCLALQKLHCNRNQNLSTLQLEGCVNLRVLTCISNGSIDCLNAVNCSRLVDVECYDNERLKVMDMSECSAITRLDCHGNVRLESLLLAGCRCLRDIYASSNDSLQVRYVTSFPGFLRRYTKNFHCRYDEMHTRCWTVGHGRTTYR